MSVGAVIAVTGASVVASAVSVIAVTADHHLSVSAVIAVTVAISSTAAAVALDAFQRSRFWHWFRC